MLEKVKTLFNHALKSLTRVFGGWREESVILSLSDTTATHTHLHTHADGTVHRHGHDHGHADYDHAHFHEGRIEPEISDGVQRNLR